MLARVQECGESSDPFPVTNGTKQGCVLAPTLFSIVFSLMLLDAFQDLDRGVYIQFRSDGGLFNLRHLQARTKTLKMLIRDKTNHREEDEEESQYWYLPRPCVHLWHLQQSLWV